MMQIFTIAKMQNGWYCIVFSPKFRSKVEVFWRKMRSTHLNCSREQKEGLCDAVNFVTLCRNKEIWISLTQ